MFVWNVNCVAVLFFVAMIIVSSRYQSFVSQTIFTESASHLSEIYHQSKRLCRTLKKRTGREFDMLLYIVRHGETGFFRVIWNTEYILKNILEQKTADQWWYDSLIGCFLKFMHLAYSWDRFLQFLKLHQPDPAWKKIHFDQAAFFWK